jgi:molecular chaperone Hsp33
MEKKPLDDQELERHLDRIAPDGIDIFLLRRGNFRGALVNGTRLVNQMRANHELGVLESFILGHAYLGGALLTSNVKGNDRMGLSIQCSGSAEHISVESSANGMVRGYLQNPEIPIDAPLDTFDMSPFIGDGILSVTKYIEDAKQPFTGSVSLEYGNIAQDLAFYYYRSEQTPTAISLSVQFDHEARIVGAGGLLVQAFPGTEDERTGDLDSQVRDFPSLGSMLSEGKSPHAIVQEQLQDFEPISVGERNVEFYCPCSKDRFSRYLAAMPTEEIRDIRDNGPFPLKTTCHNCNTTYEFSQDEIEELYQMSR